MVAMVQLSDEKYLERVIVANLGKHLWVGTKDCSVDLQTLVAASDLEVGTMTVVPQSSIN